MRAILHLSDLHFGAIDPATTEPLLGFIQAQKPDLVTISGDLTQRARLRQFREAREFIARIQSPVLVVPGNHDIPWHRLWIRLFRPLERFRQFICRDLLPFHVDDEIAVLGINTARALTTKYGRINERQLSVMAERFRPLTTHTKILVTHHPFDLPPGDRDSHQLTARAEVAMAVIATSEVDLLLSGHLHLARAGVTTSRYSIGGYAALHVHAGTATSTRGRGEVNSLNVIHTERGAISVLRHDWNLEERKFEPAGVASFTRASGRWKAVAR